jgi:type I restriction enzyme R subunit
MAKVAANTAYQNAIRNVAQQNAWVEHDREMQRVLTGLVLDHSHLYKQFVDNDSVQRWLSDRICNATY